MSWSKAQCHDHERRAGEPWHLRWLRLTGVSPKLCEKKNFSNARHYSSRSVTAKRVQYDRVHHNGMNASQRSAKRRWDIVHNGVEPRVQIPDERFHGIEI